MDITEKDIDNIAEYIKSTLKEKKEVKFVGAVRGYSASPREYGPPEIQLTTSDEAIRLIINELQKNNTEFEVTIKKI